MYSKAAALALLISVAQARFGQEQIPISAIGSIQGGSPGVAQTIAGGAVSDLLAATNPCNKLKTGDKILAQLPNSAEAIAAAKAFVAAEKNFNPFVTSIPAICSDPTLPTNPILRGITPLIDPAVANAAFVNDLSKKSLTTPFDAVGKSVADILRAQGFSNFTSVGSDGTAVPPSGSSGSSAAVSAVLTTSSVDAATSSVEVATSSEAAGITSAPAASATAVTGSIDFGLCNPQMDFVGGRPNRKPTEFTFLPIDPLTKQGQEEALNPNIITNRICDQLTNVCNSNAAAKSQCRTCQAKIQALGTRSQGTADAWNSCIIAGTAIKQDTTSGVVSGTAATTITGDAASATAINYGLCDPQMDRISGRPGRKATEFTFLPIDPLTKQGQQDALNPNIITNRICDQLTNVCNANAAAKAQCLQCKAKIAALGTRDQSTADAWNQCVIAGTQIKQDTTGDAAVVDATTTTEAGDATSVTTSAALVVATSTTVAETVDSSSVDSIASSVATTAVATSTRDAGTGDSSSADGTTSAVATTADSAAVTVTVTATFSAISTVTVTPTDCAQSQAATTTTSLPSSTSAPAQSSANLQQFTGALGGIAAFPITKLTNSNRPFLVAGDSFVNFGAACGRSCDKQHNACANAANSGAMPFAVSDCDDQNSACKLVCAKGPKTTRRRQVRYRA